MAPALPSARAWGDSRGANLCPRPWSGGGRCGDRGAGAGRVADATAGDRAGDGVHALAGDVDARPEMADEAAPRDLGRARAGRDHDGQEEEASRPDEDDDVRRRRGSRSRRAIDDETLGARDPAASEELLGVGRTATVHSTSLGQ
jgi:hypothetical protein